MSIKHAILGLLSDGPLHGYELRALYEEELVPAGSLNFGQVYTTLDRLRRGGLVQHDVVSQAERPDKKVYSLTDQGTETLHKWLTEPTSSDLDLRNETFLKLMLARRLPGVKPVEILKVEKRSCFQRLHEVMQAKAEANKENAPLQTILLLDLAVLRIEAFMKWLEHCEQEFRARGE